MKNINSLRQHLSSKGYYSIGNRFDVQHFVVEKNDKVYVSTAVSGKKGMTSEALEKAKRYRPSLPDGVEYVSLEPALSPSSVGVSFTEQMRKFISEDDEYNEAEFGGTVYWEVKFDDSVQ